MGGLEILQYTKQELRGLLTDEGFWKQPRLPITKRRAISHIANPRAEENDTLLIAAFEQGRLVAYLGILPDLLRSEAQKPVRFGWLTAWWVDKESQNRLVATMILFAAMKRYAGRVAASFPSADAIRVYEATKKFQESVKFDLSYFVLALPPSFGFASRFTIWLVGLKNRLIFRRTLSKRDLDFEVVNAPDEAVGTFIAHCSAEDPLQRDCPCWKWILGFPWLSATAEDEEAQKNYAFSVFARDFRQVAMVVRRRGAIIGFLVMTARDGRLTLKYAYYSPSDQKDVAAALQVAITKMNPWLFVSADAALTSAFRRGIPFYLARRKKSAAIWAAKDLGLSVKTQPQYGIGDIVFT
jgi:hypothetical protein